MSKPTRKQMEIAVAQAVAELEHNRAERIGLSVAEAAAELGISRQAVHKAIQRGDLGSVTVNDYERKPVLVFIPAAQVRAFKAKRRALRKSA